MQSAWDENGDGDTAKYEERVAVLEAVAAQLGFGGVARAWEVEWCEELEDLWPAVEAVAAMLVSGRTVTTEIVSGLLEHAAL